MAEPTRPDPDALLLRMAQRGRLKIFLGAAPGVGKTVEMLMQARRRVDQPGGVAGGVLIGVVEAHGRAETLAAVGDLPVLARRALAHRDRVIEEFDLDAALELRPGLLLIDELAHTNAPGSRHAKRYEDVMALLEAGITVWSTLNIQHLESLNDEIARATGVRPSETLPDRVLEMADEIELIDLPPAELRARLREGKIYAPETARRALEGFFRETNLTALREIALRRAAQRVDQDVQSLRRLAGQLEAEPTGERIVALLGPGAGASSVARQAKRLADALRAPWIALHLEGGPAPVAALTLAAQLGAVLDQRVDPGPDLAGRLLAAARAANATHLVMGRRRGWHRPGGVAGALLRRGGDFFVHVVPVEQQRRRAPLALPRPGPWLVMLGGIAAVTALGRLLPALLPASAADLVYLAVTVIVAARFGTRMALVSAGLGLLSWDFFFVPPIYRITIDSPRDLVSALVFAAVAVLTGGLAGRVRAEALAAGARVEGLRRISGFSRRLGEPVAEPELRAVIVAEAVALAEDCVLLAPGDGAALAVVAESVAAPALEAGSLAAADWCWRQGDQTGRGTVTLPSSPWRFIRLGTMRGPLAVLGVRFAAEPSTPSLQALEALADQAAAALERVRLAASSARSAALEETEALRTALLASLGHDLRTPLAGIQGAASTLRALWAELAEPARADLLAAIEQDVDRMARFLTNITDLTRIEAGGVRPMMRAVAVASVIEAAVARLPDPLCVPVQAAPALQANADPALLEHALFNIIENARKYSPQGALVGVRARAEAGAVLIEVADEGIGIPAEDLPYVFDRFFRARRADRVPPGLGLGLSIAGGLVRAMGGTIEVRSPNPDAPAGGMPGTLMTIRLAGA